MTFKVGDRVRVYDYAAPTEQTGTVAAVDSDGMLLVELAENGSWQRAHPKQCRRLRKKKERRRVWVLKAAGKAAEVLAHTGFDERINYGETCFIEVRPRPINANMKQDWNDT